MAEANQWLRAARQARPSPACPGAMLSRSELAELANAAVYRHTGRIAALDAHYVAKLERGAIRWPGADYRRALREVLGADTDAELGFHRPRRGADTAPPLPPPTVLTSNQNELERLARVLAGSCRVDRAVVTHLAEVLGAQWQIEETTGAARMLPVALAELELVEQLTRQAGAEVRPALVALVAEYHLFAGWMADDSGDPRAALHHDDRAMAAAQEVDDANAVATAFGFKSHLAWGAGDAADLVDQARAGLRDARRLSPGVRGAIIQMQARGHAMHGDDHAFVERLIDMTEQFTELAYQHPQHEPRWTYFQTPDRVLFQRGVAYLELGHYHEVGELMEKARSVLPASFRRSHGRFAACLALAHAHLGDVEEAVREGRQALGIALDTRSAETIATLRRMRLTLDRQHPDPALLDEFDKTLRELTGPE